jgi:hypothetical protein
MFDAERVVFFGTLGLSLVGLALASISVLSVFDVVGFSPRVDRVRDGVSFCRELRR